MAARCFDADVGGLDSDDDKPTHMHKVRVRLQQLPITV
jgi:hypothetical protein